MKRKVLLIKGFSKTEDELKIDNYYLNSYFQFFKSISGGAYEENDIVIFLEPKSKELNIFLEQNKLDFGVIVFIGHGANQDNGQIFQLNKYEIIKAGQFNLTSKKQIVIIESCRSKIENVFAVDLKDKIAKYKFGGYVRAPLTRVEASEIYKKRIEKCDEGISICFACGIEEKAWNFYFSRFILQVAFNWHLDIYNTESLLSIDSIMNYAIAKLPKSIKEKNSTDQTPELIGRYEFPFSISKWKFEPRMIRK